LEVGDRRIVAPAGAARSEALCLIPAGLLRQMADQDYDKRDRKVKQH
jgi:hypothetical protein